MAKMTKSDRVRAYLQDNPNATPVEVRDALKRFNITAQAVRQTIENDKKKGKRTTTRRKRKAAGVRMGRPPGRKTNRGRKPITTKSLSPSTGEPTLTELTAAASFVDTVFNGDSDRAATVLTGWDRLDSRKTKIDSEVAIAD
jgi:hypothetical protein